LLLGTGASIYGQHEEQAKPTKPEGKAQPQQRAQQSKPQAQPKQERAQQPKPQAQPKQERAQQPKPQAQPKQERAQQPKPQAQPKQERAQQPKPQAQPKQERAQQPKPQAQPKQERAQQPKPQAQPKQQQQRAQQAKQPAQNAQPKQQRVQSRQPAQHEQPAVASKPAGRAAGQQSNYAPPQRTRQQAQTWQQQSSWRQDGAWQGNASWQQDRSSNWQSDHRTWGQRGGYGGYYIPEASFGLYFGEDHWFRIRTQPIIVGGYPRFEYRGYTFMMVDPWPADWAENWYSADDVYVGYDNGYYLYNRQYPGEAIAITVVL
jgi:hypothetical protein